ncbi:MAG TPA: hypothetical protein PLE74_11360 [Candidatus Cloacimonadota bacterium]|nr:hypothetical protein [Candidatus Cloacimonadota bacterium]
MGRNYTELSLDAFKAEHRIADNRITLYVDDENQKDIFEVLANYNKHLQVVLFWMLKGLHNYHDDYYGNEDFSEETEGIHAMKFKTEGQNFRIYCREFFNDDNTKKKVIMAYAFHKKSEGIDKKLRRLLKAIGEYDYEITW